MEARVKERLTGAVVLVAIVVILVPELLSGPKRNVTPPPGSHTVRIDLTGPHHVAPAAPPATAAAEPTAEPAAGSVMSVRPDGPGVPVASEPPAGEPATDAPPPDAQPAAGQAAGPPPTARPPASPPAGPRVTAAAPAPPGVAPGTPASDGAGPGAAHGTALAKEGAGRTPPAAHAPAPAAPAPQAGSAPPAVSGWVVQLGSFANRDNAQKLVQELHHKDYSAFVAEYRGNGKVLYRVRVGPEQDRARADALRLRLGHEGYTGSVTPHP